MDTSLADADHDRHGASDSETPFTPALQLHPICFHCGYDLTGFALGDTCPECGRTIIALQESDDVPTAAIAAIVCGVVGPICGLLGCGGVVMMALAWPLASCIGLLYALWAVQEIRREPGRHAPHSKKLARIGFWLCVPGVALTIVMFVAVIYAALA